MECKKVRKKENYNEIISDLDKNKEREKKCFISS